MSEGVFLDTDDELSDDFQGRGILVASLSVTPSDYSVIQHGVARNFDSSEVLPLRFFRVIGKTSEEIKQVVLKQLDGLLEEAVKQGLIES